MSSPTIKPSKLFILHGYLRNEVYNPDLHNCGLTPEDRNEINEEGDTYYTQEELNSIKAKLKIAECPVCYEEITHLKNFNLCTSCHHKYHVACEINNRCPLCRGTKRKRCSNIYNLLVDFT